MASKLPYKPSTKHLYAAIEHRVLDSTAYADLTYSARALLTLITRQLSKDNNGSLQATARYMAIYKLSEKVVSRGIRDLITHGFIYRTSIDRMKPNTNDYKRIAAKYAVTWLPIKNRQGLYLDGFLSCAWRDWIPSKKKNPPVNLSTQYAQKGGRTTPSTVKMAVVPPPKRTDNVLVPCIAVIAGGLLDGKQSNLDSIPSGKSAVEANDHTLTALLASIPSFTRQQVSA